MCIVLCRKHLAWVLKCMRIVQVFGKGVKVACFFFSCIGKRIAFFFRLVVAALLRRLLLRLLAGIYKRKTYRKPGECQHHKEAGHGVLYIRYRLFETHEARQK